MTTDPDFSAFKEYLLGHRKASRVHLADLLINDEILMQYTREILGKTWIGRADDEKAYFSNYVRCFHHMGFDYVPVHFWIQNSLQGFPKPESWIAPDKGLITNRKEHNLFPWNRFTVDYSALDLLGLYLPEGMKLVVVTGDLQDLMDVVIGNVSFLMMIYDDPELLNDIIQKWFNLKLSLYRTVLEYDSVGAVFTCADFGSKSATLVSPDFISSELIPWYNQFAAAARAADRMYWFHSCGNLYIHNVIDLLFDQVKIDAFHSFQDSILPVTGFLEKYGKKSAALGGIDLDNLCRMEEPDLRKYIRTTMDLCFKKGRFALGTGNSLADYVPLKNWLILLDEARKYQL
jgi:uroporphyrinogen decarboxylase